AKARGAYVIGTASAGKHEFLRGLGADELVDYRTTDFAEAVRDVDVVLDGIGGEYGLRSLRTLRRGGTLVTLPLSELDERLHAEAAARGVRSAAMLVEPDYAAMRSLAALMEAGRWRTEVSAVLPLAEAGRLRPEVSAVLPLAEAAKAHELGETGRTTGKIVLTVPH